LSPIFAFIIKRALSVAFSLDLEETGIFAILRHPFSTIYSARFQEIDCIHSAERTVEKWWLIMMACDPLTPPQASSRNFPDSLCSSAKAKGSSELLGSLVEQTDLAGLMS
jgi:hypothetical protein